MIAWTDLDARTRLLALTTTRVTPEPTWPYWCLALAALACLLGASVAP